jgi:monoamine oxidase
MNEFDIIIIGAGAAGFIAARELSKAGNKVLILEGRDRMGGRIHTVKQKNFSIQIEAGAEFIHGDLPLTQELLKEAGIPFYSNAGKTYRVKKGELIEALDFVDFSVLSSRLNKLQQDMPFAEFLDKYLNEEKFQGLKESVIRFVEGYDAADIHKVSSFALREEWKSEGASNSYYIEGGYGRLINFLCGEIKKTGCIIYLLTIVKEIHWEQSRVKVICHNGDRYYANKAVITVPLGVLQSKSNSKAHIYFSPELPEKQMAINSIGYGPVIKIFLEFNEAFWEERVNELGFLLSDTPFTAWWTQLPDKTPILTGWLSGPNIDKMESIDNHFLIEKALDSLSYSFGINRSFLEKKLLAKQVINWKTDPFSLGAYAYAKVGSDESIKIMNAPVENTLFFAGEALYKTNSMGTVEAALQSGLQAARKIIILS